MEKFKNKTTLLIILLVIVTIIAIVILVNRNNKSEEQLVDAGEIQEITVEKLPDGTKIDTSSKLSETKKVGNLEINKSQITNKNGKTTLLAEVKNTGTDTIQMMELKINLIDSNGKIVEELDGLLGTIKPNETAQLNVALSGDYTNVYDYTVKIK